MSFSVDNSLSRGCSVVSRRPARVSQNQQAFTIIELIVAAAITLVVLGLMIQVTFAVLKTFDKVTGSLTTKTQATTALEYLRRDFKSIVWKRDTNVWLLATVQRDQHDQNAGWGDTNIGSPADHPDWNPTNKKPSRANPGQDYSSLRFEDPAAANKMLDLTEYRFGQAGVWLRFFTNQVTSSTDQSAPIAVAYQIVRMPPQGNSTEYRYQFFRSTVRPGPSRTNAGVIIPRSVLNAGFNLAMARNTAGVWGYNDDNNANSNSGIGEPGGVRRPDRNLLLANNVIDFGVRFWQRTSTGSLNLVFPANAAFRPSNTNLAYAATSLAAADITTTGAAGIPPINYLANADLNTGFPDFADIFLRVLTDEGARLVEAYENGQSAPPPQPAGDPLSTAQWKSKHWWTLALEHSEVFVERIPITARPF